MEKKQLTSEELASKAIKFLEDAGQYEDEGDISKALENYEKALKYLIESEYLPHRVEDIRNHIADLKKNLEDSDAVHREVKKAEKEKLQNGAFSLLEQGKNAELEGNFQNALKKYDSAISMLTEAGWSDSQLENLKDKRKSLLENYEKKKEIKKQRIVQYTTQKADRSNLKVSLDSIPELKEETDLEEEFSQVEEFFKAQKEENEIKDKAFRLIDEAKGLERKEKYDQAILKFREVVDLLRVINWSNYIEPIENLITQIQKKKQIKKEERDRRKKRKNELEELKNSLYKKRKSDLEELSQSKIQRQKQIQEQKALETEKETNLLNLLNQADELINAEKHQEAIEKYQKALVLLNDMGTGWKSYRDLINETIENLKKIHESSYEVRYKTQKKKEREIKQKEDFQEYISKKLKLERERLEQKEIKLKEKEEELEHREKLKEKAFSFMDQAQEEVMNLNFNKAIGYYQKAKNLFSEIQWTDELALIDNSIKELQKKKAELIEQKNKQMEQKLKKLKNEEEFQKRIRQKLQLERKKLKEKELSLEERENELEYQREQKEHALKFLEKGQKAIEESDYDKAIDFYRHAAKIFSTIHWKDEATLIRDSVIELEKKRREKSLREQKKFQKALEREKARNAFQTQISKKIKQERKELEKKQIKLRKREEELQYRKEKRDQAFKKLDEANKLLSRGKFEESLEIYYEVRNIFAQIQWMDELPLINEAIQEIKDKKREKNLWEQKAINKAIKEELEHSAFVEALKTRRKIEKQNELERRQKLELKRETLVNNKQKEKEAFELIDRADFLLEQERFDKALSMYNSAVEILNSIGWKGEYLKLLNETINTIKSQKEAQRKRDAEQEEKIKRLEQQNLEFQRRITGLMEKEQQRLREKELKIEEERELKEKIEGLKEKAFSMLDKAEDLLNKGEYEESIETYREAELMLNEIQFPTDLIKETILKVKEQKRKDERGKQYELEQQLQKQQEERELEKQITERMRKEQQKMRSKKIQLARQQQIEEEIEKKRENAFELLDQAQELIRNNQFEEAISIYNKVANIFENINWDEESSVIRSSIYEIEQQKKEMELTKIRQLNQLIEQEKKEQQFKAQIRKEAQLKKQELEQQRMKREEEKEFEQQIEERKKGAFILLDLADEYLSQGNYEEAINIYYDVANIFAEIQWNEEIPRIYEAIEEIREQRNDEIRQKQEILRRKIEKEQTDKQFIEKIQEIRSKQRQKELEQAELRQKQEELSAQKLERQKNAFNIIEKADKLIKKERFEEAIESYQNAINILTEIGWEGPYLKIIKETLDQIKEKEERKKILIQKEKERKKQSKIAAEKFQQKISESIKREEERLRGKKVQMFKIRQIQEKQNQLKEDAFDKIEEAETLVENKEYEKAIAEYREAELILNQIRFPTTSIREKIQKLREKKREKELEKQKEFISKLQEQREEEALQKQIAQRMRIDRENLEAKKKKMQKQEELKSYLERNKEKAFNLLDRAEMLTKEGNYEQAIKIYHDAELILSELNFPTEAIENLIVQVKEKNREKQFEKQKELEQKLQKEQRESYFKRYMTKRMEEEKQELLKKKIRVENFEKRRQMLEQKKKEAFNLLEQAETLIKSEDLEQAVDLYRNAQLALNQINYPTDAIDEMINRIMQLQEENQKERLNRYQRELERLEEERSLKQLMEERKAKEAERRKAKELALKEREKLIEKQKNYREAAYSLLERASDFLRAREPNYDKAISLYVEARNILSERIGWEPEINNLDNMIQDLHQEKAKYIEKKKQEEKIEQQKEREYQEFIEDMRSTQREYVRKQKQKQIELRKYTEQKQKIEELRDSGLEYIEQGKKFASFQRFDQAYEMLDKAIQIFRLLGWRNQIGYIKEEIAEVEQLEKEAKQREIELKKAQRQKQRQRRVEEFKKAKKEHELKETVGEVDAIAKNVSNLLEEQKKQEQLKKQKEKQKLIQESKEFGKSMGNMIKLKAELKQQIEEEKRRKKEEQDTREREKQRKEVEDIKKMLKETSKNNKNK